MDQRDMGKGGNRPLHGFEHLDLAKRIVQMIIAANDMGDAHVIVIDDVLFWIRIT